MTSDRFFQTGAQKIFMFKKLFFEEKVENFFWVDQKSIPEFLIGENLKKILRDFIIRIKKIIFRVTKKYFWKFFIDWERVG